MFCVRVSGAPSEPHTACFRQCVRVVVSSAAEIEHAKTRPMYALRQSIARHTSAEVETKLRTGGVQQLSLSWSLALAPRTGREGVHVVDTASWSFAWGSLHACKDDFLRIQPVLYTRWTQGYHAQSGIGKPDHSQESNIQSIPNASLLCCHALIVRRHCFVVPQAVFSSNEHGAIGTPNQSVIAKILAHFSPSLIARASSTARANIVLLPIHKRAKGFHSAEGVQSWRVTSCAGAAACSSTWEKPRILEAERVAPAP